jgi:hypothetical protein
MTAFVSRIATGIAILEEGSEPAHLSACYISRGYPIGP